MDDAVAYVRLVARDADADLLAAGEIGDAVNRRGGPTPIGAGVTLPALAKSRL
jgi:hypothetical protein